MAENLPRWSESVARHGRRPARTTVTVWAAGSTSQYSPTPHAPHHHDEAGGGRVCPRASPTWRKPGGRAQRLSSSTG